MLARMARRCAPLGAGSKGLALACYIVCARPPGSLGGALHTWRGVERHGTTGRGVERRAGSCSSQCTYRALDVERVLPGLALGAHARLGPPSFAGYVYMVVAGMLRCSQRRSANHEALLFQSGALVHQGARAARLCRAANWQRCVDAQPPSSSLLLLPHRMHFS